MQRSLFIALALCLCISASAQTVIDYDISPGQPSSSPISFTAFKGRYYFTAYDTVHGNELWSVDTNGVPQLVYDIAPGKADGCLSIINVGHSIGQMGVGRSLDNEEKALYFFGCSDPIPGSPYSRKYMLYRYDAVSAPSPVPITIFKSTQRPSYDHFITITDKLYFTMQDGATSILFEYNSTLGSCRQVIDMNSIWNPNFIAYKGKLIFSHKNYLKQYDPVTQKDSILFSFTPGVGPSWLTVVGNKLYMFLNTGTQGLHSYDGTTLKQLNNYPIGIANSGGNKAGGIGPPNQTALSTDPLAGYKGKICYPCLNNNAFVLCEYDTATTTTTHANINTPQTLAVAKGRLFFTAYDEDHGVELWSYDGYRARMEVDVFPGKVHGCRMFVKSFKNEIYLSGMTAYNKGEELLRYVPAKATDIPSVIATTFHGSITVYPNPANNEANIQIDLVEAQQLGIHLYNSTGLQVYEIPMKQYRAGDTKIAIPVMQLPAGSYHIRLNDNSGKLIYNGHMTKQ